MLGERPMSTTSDGDDHYDDYHYDDYEQTTNGYDR